MTMATTQRSRRDVMRLGVTAVVAALGGGPGGGGGGDGPGAGGIPFLHPPPLGPQRPPLLVGQVTPAAWAADDDPDADVIPFLDPQPFDPKRPMLLWDKLTPTDWLTPTAQVYHVSHYGETKVDAATWKLSIGGLVDKPLTLTLDDLKSR